jgi:hypothetical protein
MVAIGLSCLEEPTNVYKNMKKGTDMIQTNPVDSIKNAYSYTLSPINQDIQNIPENKRQAENYSNTERNNYDMNLNAQKKNVSSGLKYRKIGTTKTKVNHIKVTKSSNFPKNRQISKLTKDKDNKIEFNFLNVITSSQDNYPYVINSFKIFKGFYF